MGRLRTKDFDLAPGYRRINGRVYYRATTESERDAAAKSTPLSAIPAEGSLVYFVRDNRRTVKIGFTTSRDALRRRMFTLQTGTSSRIILIGAVVGTVEDERRAHAALRAHRRRGEWFNRCAVVTAYIDRAFELGRIPELGNSGKS